VLETVGGDDARVFAAWRHNVQSMREQLGWPDAPLRVRPHRGGAALALAAPIDQLFAATEVNEWAWMAARGEAELFAPGHPHGTDTDSALHTLHRLAAAERNPGLVAILHEAARHKLPVLLDDDTLSIGCGNGNQSWPVATLPTVANLHPNDSATNTPFSHREKVPDTETPFSPQEKMPDTEASFSPQEKMPDTETSFSPREKVPGRADEGPTKSIHSNPAPSTHTPTAPSNAEAHATNDLTNGDVAWSHLHSIPTALVTGSNGKTTTVRLLAAMLTTHGLRTAFSCTDGVFFDGQRLETGDYSGPAGARTVLRQPEAEAAVLETARGGLLRRGLAVDRADAAIVTNISDDHFGEYGIDDLAGLAQTKLIVARALDERGVLVLNADDAQLRAQATALACPLAWFSLDDDHERLRTHRATGGATCGVSTGHLWLSHGAERTDLGAVTSMPLSAAGHAVYNISNIAGAALLANALGIPSATIRDVLARFGSDRRDNPGRLERWKFGGITVLMDYAHNPEGLRGLLSIAQSLLGNGRLGLILGQAGNRGEPEIRALAATAAEFAPALVVLKDMEGYMRGRADGEVATILRDELLALGMAADALPMDQTEMGAVRRALAWAQAGDLLVLPVHALKAKAAVAALLDALESGGWRSGDALPLE